MNERNDITLVFSRRHGSLRGRDEHSSPKHRLCEGPEASRGARPGSWWHAAAGQGQGGSQARPPPQATSLGCPAPPADLFPLSQGLSSTSAHRSPAQMIRGVSFPLHAWVG